MDKRLTILVLLFFLVWVVVGWLWYPLVACQFGWDSKLACAHDITHQDILNPTSEINQ